MQKSFLDALKEAENVLYNLRINGDFPQEDWKGESGKDTRDRLVLVLKELRFCIKNQNIETFIPLSSSLMNAIDAFIVLANKIDRDEKELTFLESRKPKRWFKFPKERIDTFKILEFERDLSSLSKLLNEIKAGIQEMIEAYEKEFKESAEKARDGIAIGNHEDYLYYKKLIAENLFGSKEYVRLKKIVFPMVEGKIKAAIIYSLLDQLKNTKQNKIFWFNTLKFSRWYNPSYIPASLHGKTGAGFLAKHPHHLMEKDLFIFFDEDLFFIWEKILDSVRLSKSHGKSLLERMGINRLQKIMKQQLHLGVFLTLKEYLDGLRNSSKEGLVVLARENAGRLSKRLYIEDNLYPSIGFLITSLTPVMIDLLIACDVRKIYNPSELENISEMKPMFVRRSDFKSLSGKIAKFWKETMNKDLRDVYHFSIFIKVYDLLGPVFFEELKKSRIILDSKDMQKILFMMEDPEFYLFREFPSALISYLQHPTGKKLVLVTAPKDDYEFSFYNLYQQMKRFSEEKFSVHFYYVDNPHHLAEIIRRISKEKKINLLLFGAHGTETYAGYLDEKALELPCFNGINVCFESNAICYLFSCSTGNGKDPIAEKISKRFGIEVIAPEVDDRADVELDNDGEIIIYFKKGKERRFKKHLKNNQTIKSL